MPNNARRVTLANLHEFAPLLKGGTPTNPNDETDTPEADRANVGVERDPALAEAEALFGPSQFRVPMPFRRARQPHRDATRRRLQFRREPAERDVEYRELLWRKPSLDRSSVQRQPGNPTGGVRLTQAQFSVNGQRIDQTTYFRYVAFADLDWEEVRPEPRRTESATAYFRVIMLGEDYGIHELRISHKPSGEAGQNNYTTILHWGVLGTQVHDLNLVGREFDLYGPTDDGGEYLIDIH